jgi:hypothetical protein
MDGKQIEISDFLHIIRLKDQPAMFRDISDPELRPVGLQPGIYELICVPSLDHSDTYFWAVATDEEIGISPAELKVLIATGKAEWIKKPATRAS